MMKTMNPEDIAKDYRERFRHLEPEYYAPDPSAGTVRHMVKVTGLDDLEDPFEFKVMLWRCELCPHDPQKLCQRDCAEVRRQLDDGVSVTW